jgi:hypothetical protein
MFWTESRYFGLTHSHIKYNLKHRINFQNSIPAQVYYFNLNKETTYLRMLERVIYIKKQNVQN